MRVRKFFISFLLIFTLLLEISCQSKGSGASNNLDSIIVKSSTTPIFPSATGFGAFSFAGSGRNEATPSSKIIRITNLNSSGEGSLKNCTYSIGPRTCIFEVSGTILLTDDLVIRNPFLTVAGQTAPNPGITIRGGGIKIQTHDVLVQHLSVRVGDEINGPIPDKRDGIGIVGDSGAYNIVIDHCSISWAIDENFDVWYDKSFAITISNSIISEALLDSRHKDGPHSMGILLGDGVRDITIYRNLIAHNRDRNPYIKPGVVTEVINNVIYNWGKGKWSGTDLSDYAKTELDTFANIIGNYYKPGPETGDNLPIYANRSPGSNSKIYVHDNLLSNKGHLSEWELVNNINELQYRSITPAFPSFVTNILPASTAFNSVIQSAGARPGQRDEIDARVIKSVVDGTGHFINCAASDGTSRCQKNGGGWLSLRENHRQLEVPTNPNGDDNQNGYTNLEDWLFQFSASVEL